MALSYPTNEPDTQSDSLWDLWAKIVLAQGGAEVPSANDSLKELIRKAIRNYL